MLLIARPSTKDYTSIALYPYNDTVYHIRFIQQ